MPALPNIVTVIQARTGSTRLPGKIMMPLCGAPLLVRMVERVNAATLAGTVVVATTTDAADDPVEKICKEYNLNCFRGHPTDLLDRHYQTGKAWKADVVIKIPSDCPLIDPQVIDEIIEYYLANINTFDFVSNLHPPSYPDGNDVEIMTFSTLETAWKEATLSMEREHTTPFIWERPNRFRIGNFAWKSGIDYSMSHRWTIDYQEDYDFIKVIYDKLYPINAKFALANILEITDNDPEVYHINSKYAGVNWYRDHLEELKTISESNTKQLN